MGNLRDIPVKWYFFWLRMIPDAEPLPALSDLLPGIGSGPPGFPSRCDLFSPPIRSPSSHQAPVQGCTTEHLSGYQGFPVAGILNPGRTLRIRNPAGSCMLRTKTLPRAHPRAKFRKIWGLRLYRKDWSGSQGRRDTGSGSSDASCSQAIDGITAGIPVQCLL